MIELLQSASAVIDLGFFFNPRRRVINLASYVDRLTWS